MLEETKTKEDKYYSILMTEGEISKRISDLLFLRSDEKLADILDLAFWMNDYDPIGMLNLSNKLFDHILIRYCGNEELEEKWYYHGFHKEIEDLKERLVDILNQSKAKPTKGND